MTQFLKLLHFTTFTAIFSKNLQYLLQDFTTFCYILQHVAKINYISLHFPFILLHPTAFYYVLLTALSYILIHFTTV